MKEPLEKTLRAYTDIIKTTPKSYSERTEEHWNRQTDAIALQSEERNTDHFIEEELYSMQEGKVARMDELRQALRDIHEGRDLETPEGAYPVTFKNGMFHVAISDNPADEKIITLGDVLIAPAWGVEYHLNPDTVPRWVRKRYALERAKSALRHMADIQIMHDEINNDHSDEAVQTIYSIRFGNYLGKHPETLGLLMERLAESILKRFAIDCPLDIVVKDADIHEDVEQMTDFFIKKKKAPQAIAVQFTIGDRTIESIGKKVRRAYNHSKYRTDVEKVVVANVYFDKRLQTLLFQWAAEAPTALTPIDVVPADVQELISYHILKRILPKEELRTTMKTIQRYLGIVPD